MAKPIKRRRGLSGRKMNLCSRTSLKACRNVAQEWANRTGETQYVVRFRTRDGHQDYTVPSPRTMKSMLGPGCYVALIVEPQS